MRWLVHPTFVACANPALRSSTATRHACGLGWVLRTGGEVVTGICCDVRANRAKTEAHQAQVGENVPSTTGRAWWPAVGAPLEGLGLMPQQAHLHGFEVLAVYSHAAVFHCFMNKTQMLVKADSMGIICARL